jgi:hypothetical protein
VNALYATGKINALANSGLDSGLDHWRSAASASENDTGDVVLSIIHEHCHFEHGGRSSKHTIVIPAFMSASIMGCANLDLRSAQARSKLSREIFALKSISNARLSI